MKAILLLNSQLFCLQYLYVCNAVCSAVPGLHLQKLETFRSWNPFLEKR